MVSMLNMVCVCVCTYTYLAWAPTGNAVWGTANDGRKKLKNNPTAVEAERRLRLLGYTFTCEQIQPV